jgi:hypothetical protein
MASAAVTEDREVLDKRARVEFCSSALQLLRAINGSLPRICEMLRSDTMGDIVEALRFLAKAIRFNISGAAEAFNRFYLPYPSLLSLSHFF